VFEEQEVISELRLQPFVQRQMEREAIVVEPKT